MRRLQKYLAILLLALFSSIAGAEITHHHNDDDAHCYSQHDRHIHSEVHHCAFCDFSFSPLNSHSAKTWHSYITVGSDFQFFLRPFLIIRLTADARFLRGPPQLA
jgi:hypothetical protein